MKYLRENAQIRRMSAADVGRALEIAASLPESPHWPESAYLDALNPEYTPRRIAMVVAGSDAAGLEEVEGFAVASLLPPQAELESIAVAVGSQRRGLGRMLFNALSRELRAAGVIEITLEVRASNRAALAFYRRAGFSQTGLRSGYYTDPVEDAVLMRLNLA
jgi:[ribosomal protein S18]-alanine N-acetyltransferase